MIRFCCLSRKCLVLLLVLMLAGCGALPAKPPKPELTPCMVAGEYGAKCGTLSVFEDRQAQSGRKIDLQIVVVPARSGQPAADPIFFLQGGPGGSAIDAAGGTMEILGPANEFRDVVFVDQRGTGGSHKLECPRPPQPEREAEAIRNCLPTLDGDPRAYTTAWGMDDLDDVRAALGYDKINLYGGSYAGTAQLVYILRHGEHVRAAAMNGTTLLDVPLFERWPVTSQKALEAWFARCEADAACDSAFPNLRQEFAAIPARLDQAPITLPITEAGQPVVMTSELFSLLVHSALKNTETAVLVPKIIHLVYTEDSQGLVDLLVPFQSGDSTPPPWSMMALTTECYEPWARLRRSETPETYLTYDALRRNEETEAVCAVMPRPKEAALYGPLRNSSVPILFINGSVDPQAPPENVARARERYPNSRSLVFPFQAHSYSGSMNSCQAAIMAEFFASGSPKDLNTDCIARVELPDFVK